MACKLLNLPSISKHFLCIIFYITWIFSSIKRYISNNVIDNEGYLHVIHLRVIKSKLLDVKEGELKFS